MLLPFLGVVSGSLLLIHACMLIAPVLLALFDGEGPLALMVYLILIELVIGFGLLATFQDQEGRLRVRDGFVLVSFTWCFMSLVSAIPLSLGLSMPPVDALFETVSGVTTTGATVLMKLDGAPRSMLFYRQELQWVGGIGVVVSAIALFPMLGIGGMQLLKTELPGPVKSERMRPRLRETARAILGIYLLITFACAGAFWLAGMPIFDAVAHSMATVSTGGFSTHDASLGYFDSAAVELIAMVFMLVGSINFSLHYLALKRFRITHYFSNEEVRSLVGLILVVSVLVSAMLIFQDIFAEPLDAFRYASFQVVSVITSTGFATQDFTTWPLFVPVLLIFISFVGGCAGSTAGGMKVLRFVVLGKQAGVEIRRLYHPHLVREITLGQRVVPVTIVQAIWAYCAIYVTVFAILMVVLMFDGMDQVTAFGAVATSLNNLGPGLGEVATNFNTTSTPEKWVLCLAMLLGRLELFPIFVLFVPSFWRD
jgi:trk system potassium uptake protein TrkH